MNPPEAIHPASDRPHWRRAVRFGAGLTLLQALPWLLFLLPGISLISVASESIGYRYFHSFRLVRGEPAPIWAAQGQTLGVLHQAFQGVLDTAGLTSLQVRIDLFSYGTLAANSILFGLLAFGLAASARVDRLARWLLGAAALFSVYGSWWSHAAARLPDYYTWEVTLTFACAVLFVIYWHAPVRRFATIAGLGALGGLMIGMKITLLPAALLPLLPTLLAPGVAFRHRALHLAAWLVSAALALAFIILAYYRFDLGHLLPAFQAWRTFVAAPGAEPGFIASILNPFASGHNPWADHRYAAVAILLWLIPWPFAARRQGLGGWLRLVSLVTLSALHVVTVIKRPAETTLFESTLFLTTLAGCLLATQADSLARRRASAVWLAVLSGWCLYSSALHLPRPDLLATYRQTSRQAWEIHHRLNSLDRPVVVLLPDNRYTSGSVEEALLKGFSDVPTWDITTGYALLDTVAPRRLFVTRLSAVPPGSVVVWAEGPQLPAPFPMGDDVPPAGDLKLLEHRTWPMQRNAYWSRTVHAAVYDAGPADGAGGALVSDQGWTEATPDGGAPGFFISPSDAAPRLEVRVEGGRQVLRITATKASSYLAIGAKIRALPEHAGAIRLDATVRTNRARTLLWQLYDVVDDTGRAETVVEPINARDQVWLRWVAGSPGMRGPASIDNFSVGIVAATAGDWFEVMTLELRHAGATTPSSP